MTALRTPAWRIAGSFVSWLLFVFSFAGLFQTSGVVIGLGGYCASGGPYVIETQCPEAVVLFAPLGIFGMLVAVGIGLFVAQHFGTPLFPWAWPILFVGLGIQFLLGALGGASIVTNVLLGVMFVAMGLVPWWFTIRGGAQPFLIGTATASEQPFAFEERRGRDFFARARPDGEPITPRPGDWVLALGISIVGTALGAWLSVLAFRAVGSGA
jgi:hypothetical protein